MDSPPDKASTDQAETMFSVVMPSYNHQAYIDAAIQSIRDQTFGDWELIIVDDGSSDDSPAIAQRHAQADARITVISQTNAGPAAARNAGIGRARGPWLAFLDSDDLWYSETLELYARKIADQPAAEFIYGYRDRLNPDGTVTRLPGEHQDSPSGTAELFAGTFLSTMSVCHRKDLFDRVGGFDQSLRSCEDYELYLRMSLLTHLVPIGRATGLRRRHGGNLSAQSGFSRFQEAEILRRFARSAPAAGLLPAELIARRLGRLYYCSGREYFKSFHLGQAAVALAESMRFSRSAKVASLKLLCTLLGPLGRREAREIPWLSDQAGRD